MEIQLEVKVSASRVEIQLENNQGEIDIAESSSQEIVVERPTVYLLLKDEEILSIGEAKETVAAKEIFDKVIRIMPPWETEAVHLAQLLIKKAEENGVKLTTQDKTIKVPANAEKVLLPYLEKLQLILEKFGYPLYPVKKEEAPKAKPAKARHRWSKEVSQMEFSVDTRESKGTVIWQKRNEMLLKAGAVMMPQPPLNKDGSLGFAAKFGEKIRSDHQTQFKNFVTTEDIVLKSVNEIGLFLYFGGTNSWLELVDKEGKSIDAWTRVD